MEIVESPPHQDGRELPCCRHRLPGYHGSIRRLLPPSLILIAVLSFYRTVLFVDGYTLPWDFRGYHLPLATAYADSVHEGVLPLWEPYSYCGRPLLANPQAAIFHPAMFLAAIGGRDGLLARLEWSAVLMVALAGWIVALTGRRMGLTRWPATLAGLMFALGGLPASQAQHWSLLAGLPALALGWLGLTVASPWRIPIISAAFCLSFLGGFPALTLASAASTLLLAMLLREGVQAVLASALLSLAISGAQLLPSLELASLSVGKYRTDWLSAALDTPPIALLSLFWPNHLHVFNLSEFKAPYQLTSVYLFSSVSGLALALAGLWRARKGVWRAVAITCFACMLLMFGQRAPVGAALNAVLPDVLRNIIYWQLFMAPFLLALSLLAGSGCMRFPRAGPVLTILVAAECILVSSNRPMNLVREQNEPLVTATAIDGSEETARALRRAVGDGRFDTVDESPHLSAMAPIVGIRSANGYDPLVLERLIRFRMTFAGGARWGAYQQIQDTSSKVPAMAGVGALVSRKNIDDPRWHFVTDLPGRKLYTSNQPRYRLVFHVLEASSMDDAARMLPKVAPATEAIAEGFKLDSKGNARLRVLLESRTRVVIETESDAPVFLATSEAHYPGWRAFVDGTETPILYTNVAFRGLALREGRHTVVFQYGSSMLRIGFLLSLSGVIFWALLVFRARRKSAA